MQDQEHCSEMPIRYWLNLFDFFGYGAILFNEEGDPSKIVDHQFFAYRRGENDDAGPDLLSALKFKRYEGLEGVRGNVWVA